MRDFTSLSHIRHWARTFAADQSGSLAFIFVILVGLNALTVPANAQVLDWFGNFFGTETTEGAAGSPQDAKEAKDTSAICPEDMRRIAERQGGIEACGTGRPPAAPAHPLDGVWDVSSPGNPKIDGLIIYMNSQYGILHRRNPNKPSPAQAVWRLKGKENFTRTFAVRLSMTDGGAVEMGLGQFGFCSCRKIKWRVEPTADPNVFVGEWSFEEKQGASIWRRRPMEGKIDNVKISKAAYVGGEWQSDLYAYGSRPGKITRRHPVSCGAGSSRGNCDTVWINVYGENFAGAHNVWIDPATRMELRDAGWLCLNGDYFGSGWDRCGVGTDPGSNVTGIYFKLILWDGMVPGPVNVWVDGQPIPINIELDGYPDQEPKPSLVSLAALDEQDTQLSELKEGVPFILKAVFDADHPDDWVSVDVPIAASSIRQAVLRKTDDPKIFVSEWLRIEAAATRR